MSDAEEPQGCQACAAFEPQAWRKSLCRNCFHTLEEHSEELLAKEAEAVAKEKAAKTAAKPPESSTGPGSKLDASKSKDTSSSTGKNALSKASEKDAKAEKDSAAPAKDAKKKLGVNRSNKDDSKSWSWGKDLGLEYGKPGSKSGTQAAAASAKGKVATTTAAPSASTSSSPKSTSKSATSLSSASSSTTSTTTASSTMTTTTSSTSTSTTSTPAVSKAKNFASKFESKAAGAASKDKPFSKPSEIRTGGSSVAALSGKLSHEDAGDSKTSSKASPESKSSESTKSTSSKVDSKPSWKKTDEIVSKFSKGGVSKAKDDDKSADEKDVKKDNESLKDKKSLLNKTDEKDSKFSVGARSKAAPFGKDLLKSTKDSIKKNDTADDKLNTSKTKDDALSKGKDSLKSTSPKDSTTITNDKEKPSSTAKFMSGKFGDDKNKKKEEETETKSSTGKLKTSDVGQNAHTPDGKLAGGASRSPRDSEQTNAGSVNKPGHLAKTTGKSADGKTDERPESKDKAKLSKSNDDVIGKCQNNKGDASPSADSSKLDRDKSSFYRDRGKEKGGTEGEGARKDETAATLPSSPVGGKQVSSALSPSPSSKPTTPTTPISSSADSKTSSPFFSGSKAAADKKPKDLKLDTGKQTPRASLSPLEKFKGLEKTSDKSGDKESSLSSLKSPSTASPQPSASKDDAKDKTKEKATAGTPAETKDVVTEKLREQLKEKEEKVAALEKQLSKMEEQMEALEKEKEELRKSSIQSQKDDMEKLLQELRGQLSKMEGQCSRLETDNQTLIDKLHVQEASVKRDQECRGRTSDNVVLEEDLEAAEQELEDVKDENKELQRQIMEMKNEMDEMYDHFRENEHDEFRELQKELDMTAKNCRILQFKLRKAERRNDQIEEDRLHYEEKLRMLQDQFDSQDAKNHIRVLEEELRMAKEVSVRLHDELDIVDDKKNKALEENRHLTELLEHTDKRQFRMEMEIDKLRDIVADLRQQLKEARSGNNNNNNNNKDASPDRKPPALGAIGKQGSKEYDVSQLMKDLCDSMERENDLKDQLKFTEEEAKMMRRRVSDMDEENENLRLQLQKMSEKASKHKKKEKERTKELEEERSRSGAVRAALTAQKSEDDDGADLSTDVILVVGAEGSDIISGDEPIPVTERKDSTDEDLMNVMQMRVQLEMVEQELMTSHKKLDEMDLENENLQAEVKFLQERLAEKEASASGLPEPSTPNAYYEDKLKELTQEVDELRWKLIEKDRELERLSVVQVQTRHGKEHKKVGDKLKKSKSLESENRSEAVLADLRKQLEQSQMEVIRLKKTVEELEEQIEELRTENDDLKNRTPVPSVRADDAAVENIELKDKIKRLEDDNKSQADKIKSLTDSLQKLSRDTRTYTSIATSPTVPGTLCIPGIPLVGPGTQTAAARAGAELTNQTGDGRPRDLSAQLHVLRAENEELRRLMGEWEGNGKVGGKPGQTAETGKHITGSTEKSSGVSTGIDSTQSYSKTKSGTGTKEVVFTTTESQGKRSEESVKTNEKDSNASAKKEELNATVGALETNVKAPVSQTSTPKTDKDTMEKEKEKDSTTTTTKGDGGGAAAAAAAAPKPKGFDEVKESVDEDDDYDDSGRKLSEEEPRIRSILLDYPEGKSKVLTSGSETRVELMEKVLDMDDEISELLSVVRRTEEQNERLRRMVKGLQSQLREIKDDCRRTELELLQELDMLHDKNSVMSNLLDIINERAEAAEEELERRHHEEGGHSPVRSASNVSQVSALSDTSMGSDEVFLNAHGQKEGVITRDWEAKLKGRIESLERLLAEERQKVSMAEKKLLLAGIDSISPSVSDDVKLRMREKELLQEELLKSQRHLHIATDQIQGLKERINILEEEHERLKKDYGKLYDELDKSDDADVTLTKEESATTDASDKASLDSVDAEPPFVAKRISVVEAPKFRELKRLAEETNEASEETSSLEEELAKYKQKAKELEYKVEEIDDIWRSKSAASDKEKNELEKQLTQKVKDLSLLEETIANLKLELCAKDKIIAENEVALREKDQEISRYTDMMKDREGETKRREHDHQTLLTQISQRDNTVRGLNETIRIRDERLREKDDILCKLNSSLDEYKREMNGLAVKLDGLAKNLSEKDAEISVLRGQLSNSSVLAKETPRSCQTDAEKESYRLRETLKKLQGELDKAMGEKRALESTLEKSRKALDDAMLMWDKERNELQREANILEEKVRMYEAYNTMNKDETIDALKLEAQAYFSEKEKLLCELSTIKLKYQASDRVYKEQMAKLQSELTEKLRLLKAEVDNSSHIHTELERLRRQAEMAYRLQQEQRVLKAEHLAMKVRYETRIDKMSKEHNKMMITIEKLQKERDLDQQIIQGMQKNLSMVKDKYTDELLRLEEEKTQLHRQVIEIEESRGHLEELQHHIRDLREKTTDQDRLRAELINKFATDRSSWEIDRANLISQINQLEEQISSSSKQQERSKDIQVNMGMAWEKERREQRRLLAEAHTLALDLQEQLRSRDEAFAHERKELIRQMESDRLTWSKDKREAERKMMEIESAGRKVASLQKRLKETEERCEKDHELWQKEKVELEKSIAEARHGYARDMKRVEDVLSKLIRLRELGTMLTSQPKWDNLEEKPPDITDIIDQTVIDYVKEAIIQISHASDDLTMITNPTSDETAIKRISNSEIDLLKDELSHIRREGNAFVISDVSTSCMTTTTRIEEESAGISRRLPKDSSPTIMPHRTPNIAISETVTKSSARDVHTSPTHKSAPPTSSSIVTKTNAHVSSSAPKHQVPTPVVVMRPFDAALSRRYDRPPSYTSGTRSAQSSRATTPDIAESAPGSADTSPVRKVAFPETTSPSFVIPHHKSFQPRPQQQKPLVSALASGHSSGKPKRPVTFMKSYSVDSAPVMDSYPSTNQKTPPVTSVSANTTPTQPVTSADIASSFSTPSVISHPSGNHLSVSRDFSPRSSSASPSRKDKFSPRTARRKFFEDFSATSAPSLNPPGYQSWPERRSASPSMHTRQQSLPNPDEVRREAEEEYDHLTSRLEPWTTQTSAMKTSASWDEKMHHKVAGQEGASAPSVEAPTNTTSSPSTTAPSTSKQQQSGKSQTAKDKRKLFKKSTSLDSTVGSSIANIGVSAMPLGAPTGFTPSEIFAAVKGKLKPVFKKKHSDSKETKGREPREPSPLFIQTEVPDIHFASQGSTSLPVPVPHVDVDQLETYDQDEGKEYVSELQSERSRDSHRDSPRSKWRSKSADRAQAGVTVHGDVIRSKAGVWKFNETAV